MKSQLTRGRTKISGLKNKQGKLVSIREEIMAVVHSFICSYVVQKPKILTYNGNEIRNVRWEEIPEIDNAELTKAFGE